MDSPAEKEKSHNIWQIIVKERRYHLKDENTPTKKFLLQDHNHQQLEQQQ